MEKVKGGGVEGGGSNDGGNMHLRLCNSASDIQQK